VALKRRGAQARRQPARRIAVAAAPEFQHQPFEVLVEMALDDLPVGVRKLLENVAVVIEDEPSEEQLRNTATPDTETMYGLYEGVSPVEYGADWVPFPNKITIFRLPLEEDFPNPEDLAREVQETVMHEIGHHAGYDHSGLRSLGFDD
jgi:predicted Zn-dependent protease with MMP-like domain